MGMSSSTGSAVFWWNVTSVVGLLTLMGSRGQAPTVVPTVSQDVMIPKTEMRTTRRNADLRDVLEHMDATASTSYR